MQLNSQTPPAPLFHALLLFAVACALILGVSLPTVWTQNEVNYFDLAYQHVRPDLFTSQHAVRDSSEGRFFAFTLIGGAIEALGMDRAKTVLALLFAPLQAAFFVWMTRALRIDALSAGLALALFVLTPQSFLGHEWIFRSVEAKVPAYIASFAALALAARCRWAPAALAGALGTYFHFLVGGFWGLAALLLIGLRPRAEGGGLRPALLGLALFAVAIGPQFWILLSERLEAPAPDMTGLEMSLPEIYAAWRNPHHVAPFLSVGDFVINWMQGALLALAATGIFALAARRAEGWLRTLSLWLALLNGYILLALVIAFFDRGTHLFSALYLFRPAALILLLSLLGGCALARAALGPAWKRAATAATVLAIAAFTPQALLQLRDFARAPVVRGIDALDPDARALAFWARENTAPGAVFLVEPGPDGTWSDAAMPRLLLERLMQRPTLVNWKFVPTMDHELARWRRLLMMRDAVFSDGECARLSGTGVRYLVLETPPAESPAAACGAPVWSQGRLTVLERPGARAE